MPPDEHENLSVLCSLARYRPLFAKQDTPPPRIFPQEIILSLFHMGTVRERPLMVSDVPLSKDRAHGLCHLRTPISLEPQSPFAALDFGMAPHILHRSEKIFIVALVESLFFFRPAVYRRAVFFFYCSKGLPQEERTFL